jgi:hypothetical protein
MQARKLYPGAFKRFRQAHGVDALWKPNAALPSISARFHADLYSSRRAAVNYYRGTSAGDGRHQEWVFASAYCDIQVTQS